MKKIIIILSLIFLAFTFVACNLNSSSSDPKNGASDGTTGDVGKTDGDDKDENEYITVTVEAVLKANYTVKVQAGSLDEKSLSSGNCVNVRDVERLVISAEQDNVVSHLCSNIDDDENNNCEGSYNVIYTLADSKIGANKLTLESVDRNESEDCKELFPVYTITMKSGLADKTLKVYNDDKAKTLQVEGSCLKLTQDDFSGLQIDEGVGDENRRVLCESGRCAEDNYEISLYGQPPAPNSVIFNSGAEYNKSKSCEWFNAWWPK